VYLDFPNGDVMDQFPQKRQALESLNNRVDIEPVMHIIQQVVQYLMTKAIHESRKQDRFNQTILGNVSFYLAYNEISKETKLTFDKHPKVWKVKEIIEDMLNSEADMMMEKDAYRDMDMLDNPFTY